MLKVESFFDYLFIPETDAVLRISGLEDFAVIGLLFAIEVKTFV